MELVHLGPGGMVAMGRIVAIANPNSAPIKRMVRRAQGADLVIDMTYGLRRKAVIVFDSGHIVLAPVNPEEIGEKGKRGEEARKARGALAPLHFKEEESE